MTTGAGARARWDIPALIAGGTVVLAWLILIKLYRTPLGSAVLYLGFLAAYVYLPGWLVYRVLTKEPGGWIRQLALAGGLGYVLSILAFMLTAAADIRPLLDFYPLIVGIPAALVLVFRYRREGPAAPGERVPAFLSWAIAAVGVVILIYVGVPYFAANPLPGIEAVRYAQDFTWAMSVAADFLHHWPVMEASEVGEPVPYHYFAHIHVAMASQVTGIELPVVFLRLWILPVAILALLQFVEAGRSLFGSAAVGLTAAALAFLVAEVAVPLDGVFNSFVILSPSFIFGLIFLLPLFVVIGERLNRESLLEDRGGWVLLATLAVGAAGAKVTVVPLLIGSLAILGSWDWFRSRRFPRGVLAIGLVLVAVQTVYYLLLYRGHSSGLSINFSAGIDYLRGVSASGAVKDELLDLLPFLSILDGPLNVLAVPLTLIAMFGAPLIGLVWFFRRSNRPLSPVARWLCCVGIVGFIFLAVVQAVGTGNQLYFAYYGLLAGVLMSAAGIRIAFQDRQAHPEHRTAMLLLLGLWALFIVASFLVFVNPGWLDPDDFFQSTLVGYVVVLLGLGVLWMVARRILKHDRSAVTDVVAAAFVMFALITVPNTSVRPALKDHDELTSGYRMTPGLYGALRWMRSETSVDEIFIVNNQEAESVSGYATAYDYAAFSERRAFLAGWGYSISARDAGYDRIHAGFNPFSDRQALNEEAFAGGAAAIGELKTKYGVRYALVDGINGDPDNLRTIKAFGKVVYETPDATVIDLGSPGDLDRTVPEP